MSAAETHLATAAIPYGRYAIEASAGTGKTYALANLALRYIAEEGLTIDQMLIVTFTRAAAADLRDRVRKRLVEAEAVLAESNPSAASAASDEVLVLLASADRESRHQRILKAIENFDTATVTTIHGFVSQTLTQLGIEANGNMDAELISDTDTLLNQVIADCLVSAVVADKVPLDQLPDEKKLSAMAKKVLGNHGIDLLPEAEDLPDDTEATIKARQWRKILDQVIAETVRRRRDTGTMSFDDLLTQLRDAVKSDPLTAATLQSRYQVALIDEFQDTDPVQWAIFAGIFSDAAPKTSLVMVGDPKQAIYGFRGADIHTYLAAVNTPGTVHRELEVNWRSDGAVIRGLNALFQNSKFGDERITYIPVKAAPNNEAPRIRNTTSAPERAPVEVRIMAGEDIERTEKTGNVQTGAAAVAISKDLVSQTRVLLATSEIPNRGDDGYRTLRPADIAVLVHRNKDAVTIQSELVANGIPAVVARGANVLDSDACQQWQELLAALLDPTDPTRARAAARTWFFGWSAEKIAVATDEELAEVQKLLNQWETTLISHGVTEFCAQIWHDSKIAERVLGRESGYRDLTDLEHVGELLQAEPSRQGLSTAQLSHTLSELVNENKDDPSDPDIFARRVESEAEAVQVMTIHGAKGLEFPVVLVPTLWRGRKSLAKKEECIYVDTDTQERTFDIANECEWPDSKSSEKRRTRAMDETRGEQSRLAYVALTRAQHLCIIWWSPTEGGKRSPLAALLMAGAEKLLANDGEIAATFAPQVTASAGALAVTTPGLVTPPADLWVDPLTTPAASDLVVAPFGRDLKITKERWSFSKISNRDPHGAFSTPAATDESLGDRGAADEPVVQPEADEPEAGQLPLGSLPKGAEFGTLVHQVLDDLDFCAPNVKEELRARIETRWGDKEPGETIDKLTAGLIKSLESPLGPLLDNRTLKEIARKDYLAELNFELRLGDGKSIATDCDLGGLCLDHLAPDDPLRPWAEKLAAGIFNVSLEGHLTGSIDAVFRVSTDGGPERFVISDYKTNGLNKPGQPMTAQDYHPDLLALEMAKHHYPLQALLYSVALHRYLNGRLANYDPEVNLGGAAYLFVRGMEGPETPKENGQPNGVFSWKIPSALVVAASNLLAGNSSAVGGGK